MKGMLFIVSAPSGAGKSSLVNALLSEIQGVYLSISYTTRAPRLGEQDGREYNFVDMATFEMMMQHGEFLECAEVHGNRYGTSKAWIAAQMAAGRDVVLEIDWQGAEQVRRIFPDSVGVFILPPSLQELERRLVGRGQDSKEVIAARVAAAHDEISHAPEFDYVIINKEFVEAQRDLQAVVRCARLKMARQLALHHDLFNL